MTEDQEVSEALLSAAAAGHRVRNIREKIEDIGETSQLGRREGEREGGTGVIFQTLIFQ